MGPTTRKLKSATGLALCLLMQGACGDGKRDTAADVDGGARPDDSDAAANRTCTARLATGSLEGFDVVFHDSDGAPLATVQTDAEGVATYDGCVADGMVTFVNDGTTEQLLITYQGVQPGDVVQWDQPALEPMAPLEIQFQSPDGGELVAGASQIRGRFGSCTTLSWEDPTGGFMKVNEPAPCLGEAPGDFDVLATASDGNGNPIAFSRGTSTVFNGAPIAVTGGAWVPFDGPSSVPISTPSGLGGGVQFYNLIDGVRTSAPEIDTYNSGVEEIEVNAYPAGIADGYELVFTGLWTGTSAALTTIRGDELPSSLDMELQVLEAISSTALDTDDAERPAVIWEGGRDETTYVGAGIMWIKGEERGLWLLMAPGGTEHRLQAPALPESLDADRPGPGAELLLAPNFFQNDTSWASYRELLARGVTLPMISGLLFSLPSNGVFRHVFFDADGI